jgi:maltose O-acetyltransferase
MTEREKMLAGEPYQSRDPELLALYHRTKALLQTFASTASTDTAGKQEILRSIFGSVGSRVWIESPFACDYGVNIRIGDDCFINYNCVFLDSHQITIGNNVLIGPAVQLYTAGHPLLADERIIWDEKETERRYVTRALPISIGDRAWIGGGAIVMPGVKIGSGTTVGAGSVVTKDIPEGCFAAGNPCRVIRAL